MRNSITCLTCLLVLVMALAAPCCWAETIEIEFTGLELEYDGTDIFDSDPTSGADPNPLTSVAITIDNVLAGPVLTNDLTIDIRIPAVSGLPMAGGSAVSAAGGHWNLDLGAGGFIELNLDTVEVNYIDISGIVQFVFAASVNAAVDSQSLPFGLIIGDTVNVSFSTQVSTFTADPGNPTLVGTFLSAGTGEIKGPLVPEPPTAAMGLIGLLGLATFSLRRRRRK